MVTAPVDPEFDPTPPAEPGVCRGGSCDGSGWKSVGEAYVDRWAGPPPSIPEGETPEERREFRQAHRAYQALRAAFRRSSYPCPACQPALYDLWAGGHLGRYNHDAGACPVCRENDRRTGKRVGGGTRKTAAVAEPVHADRDAPPEEPEQIRADLR